MAIYSFRCEDGHTFDEIRPVAERDDVTPCEVCGKTAKRVVTQMGRPTGGDTPKFFPGRW